MHGPNSVQLETTSTLDDRKREYLTCAGCTDASACNYDQDATIEDGSCDFACYGCTDPIACNYDATSTLDDGNCEVPHLRRVHGRLGMQLRRHGDRWTTASCDFAC